VKILSIVSELDNDLLKCRDMLDTLLKQTIMEEDSLDTHYF